MDTLDVLNTSEATTNSVLLPGLINDETFLQVLVGFSALNIVTSVFATGANIITIIVYFKIGFADSTNISLTALAFSDLGVAVTALVSALLCIVATFLDVTFTMNVTVPFGGIPHLLMTRVSSTITAYISIERYVCVFWPLKVKSMITAKRTFIIMVFIYGFFLCFIPGDILFYPTGWRFDAKRNKTILDLVQTTNENVKFLYKIQTGMRSTALPFLTYFAVWFCTVALSLRLQKTKAWRDTASNATVHVADKGPELSARQSKEAKAVKLVVSIATVFIVCNLPPCTHIVLLLLVPGYSFNGRYNRLVGLLGIAFFGINSINSGANLIIYFRMSSKFRTAMLGLFGKKD